MRIKVRTAVYRCYDADGALLYVGMTGNPPARFTSHQRWTPWWSRVERIEIAWFDSRDLAADAEAAAVAAEHPEHNHNLVRHQRPPAGTSYLDATGRRHFVT